MKLTKADETLMEGKALFKQYANVEKKTMVHGNCGTKNAAAKLTEEMVMIIKTSDRRPVDLGAEFNVNPMTISHVRLGHTWAHVGPPGWEPKAKGPARIKT